MNKPTILFWVVAVLGLLWNLMGVSAFVFDMMVSPDQLAEMEDFRREYYENNPIWNKAAYGIATICGALGCLGLLLRKPWAEWMFTLSLIALLLNNVYTWLISNAAEYASGTEMGLSVAVVIIALGLWYFSKLSKSKGWIAS